MGMIGCNNTNKPNETNQEPIQQDEQIVKE